MGDGKNSAVNRKRKNTDDYFEVDDSDNGEINVLITDGKMITLRVKGSLTIGALKIQIQENVPFEEIIPFHEQELIFNEKVLNNINTLADLRIKKHSTLKLWRKSVETMEIFVKTFTGNTVSLSVKPTDTIEYVKMLMQFRLTCDVKKNVLADQQVLMFNNVVLGDKGTLFDFGIVRKSTLMLMYKPCGFRGFMKIFIKTVATMGEETITMEVKPSCNIGNIKEKIKGKMDIPVDEQELIFNEVALHDANVLADCDIDNESTLTLMRKPRGFTGFMQIFIKTCVGETIALEVKPSDAIRNIKEKILGKMHIPIDEQELIFNQVALHEANILAECNIKRESTLTLMRISIGYMRIFIKTYSGMTFTFQVKPSDTICNVKAMIHAKEGIPLCYMSLFYNKKQLENSATLADYHIHSEAAIELVLRISASGGCVRLE